MQFLSAMAGKVIHKLKDCFCDLPCISFLRYNQPKVAVYTKAAPKMILRLSVEFTDGSTQNVVSDAATDGVVWQQHQSPVLMDDIYAGETYDASLETPGWDTAAYTATGSRSRLSIKVGHAENKK